MQGRTRQDITPGVEVDTFRKYQFFDFQITKS